MNLEQRQKQFQYIRQLEGLLQYALKHNDQEEIERIRRELNRIIDRL